MPFGNTVHNGSFCLKIALLDTFSLAAQNIPKCGITPKFHLVFNAHVGRATFSHKADDCSYFHSPYIGCPKIDQFDEPLFTLAHVNQIQQYIL